VITVGLVIVVAYFLIGLLARLVAGEATADWAVGQGIAFVVTAVVTTVTIVVVTLALYFGVTAGTDFIQRFVAGRAVGKLGIVIAGIGVLGERYQLATHIVIGS
jgi:hypothetical protein